MTCPNCGESTIGNGIGVVIHCPRAFDPDYEYAEPDCQPVFCLREDQIHERLSKLHGKDYIQLLDYGYEMNLI